MKIILASGSPRRRELLSQIGLEYQVEVSETDEDIHTETPGQFVRELSEKKANAVFVRHRGEEGVLVIGADTVVSCDGKILGKPADEADAVRMLKMLSGREHEVFTGVTVIAVQEGKRQPEVTTFAECTKVHFYEMSEEEIRNYAATEDPLDKAGAYGIQGFCARFIKGIEGDYNNVVGLPAGKVYQVIKKYL